MAERTDLHRKQYPRPKSFRRRFAEQEAQNNNQYEVLNNDTRFFRVQTAFFVLFYVTVFLLVIGTTDKILFLETPIRLPFVGADLSLTGFYIFTPVLLLSWHFLILFHTYQHYQRLTEAYYRHPRIFDQLTLGWFEQIIIYDKNKAWVCLNACLYLLLPLTVLITFLYRFADYQNLKISIWHFFLINSDMLFIARFCWLLTKQKKRIPAITGVLFACIWLYQCVALIPVQYPETPFAILKYYRSENWPSWIIPHLNVQGKVLVQLNQSDATVLNMLHGYDNQKTTAIINARDKLPITDRSKRLFRFANFTGSVMPNTDFSSTRFEFANLSDAKMVAADFRGAHLEGADLFRARLEGADLQEVHLEGADLREARLEKADLSRAHLEGAELTFARLEGADLQEAHLEGADLREARLEKADLFRAHLEGAELTFARLEGADLREARLEGAILREAHLEGAILREAHLEGADLREARLDGAILFGARLEGADLFLARLKGTDLREARFEGAILQGARLDGADLLGAHLEGAILTLAHLEGAILRRARLDGADLFLAYLQGASDKRLDSPRFADRVDAEDYLQSDSVLFHNQLSQKTIDSVRDRLLQSELSAAKGNQIVTRLQQRIDQTTNTTGAQFGPLIQSIVDAVDERVTHSKTREQLGLSTAPPVINNQKSTLPFAISPQ